MEQVTIDIWQYDDEANRDAGRLLVAHRYASVATLRDFSIAANSLNGMSSTERKWVGYSRNGKKLEYVEVMKLLGAEGF